MNKKVFNIILAALVLIGLGAGLYFYTSLIKRPVFSVFEAKQGNIAGTVRLYGKVNPENNADLGFELGGKITALNYKVGDYVAAGDVLVRSNAADLQAQYNQSIALRDSAEDYLEQYEDLKDKDNYKLKSLKQTATANSNDKKSQKEQVEADKDLVDYQENQLKAAEAGIQLAAARLNKAIIRAPFSGVITKQDSEVGEVFALGAPVLTLVNSKTVKIEVWASELEVKNLTKGNEAQVILDNDQGHTYTAKIDAIDPNATLMNNVSAYKVTLHLTDNNVKITLGTDVQVNIIDLSKEKVLLIPKEAVFSENGKSFVYLSNKEKREVQTGLTSADGMVEITNGLSLGDNVVLPK